MITNLSPIQQLDYVLNFLATDDFGKQPLIERQMLIELKEKHDMEFPIGDFNRILYKLVNDGYLDKEVTDNIPYFLKDIQQPPSTSEIFFISFDGKLFNESGGYQEKIRLEKIEVEQIKSDLALRKRNDRRLVRGTYGVAFGAVALVVWDLIKFFCLKEHP
jgi:hypothetical protein